MRLLLDTHAFLWFVMGDPRLSAPARTAIEDPSNSRFFSLASAWEIGIKTGLGKLTLHEPFEKLIPREVHNGGFQWLPIRFEHIARLPLLPTHHRDPFDRLLIAQAQYENFHLVTADMAFVSYPVLTIW